MTNREKLEDLARRWRGTLWRRAFGCALDIGGLALIALALTRRPAALALGAGFAGIAALAWRLARHRPWQIDAGRVARHLDRTYPEMEESGALFLRPAAELTLLEGMQLKRVVTNISTRHTARTAAQFGLPAPRTWRHPARWARIAILVLATVALVWTIAYPRPRPRASERAAATDALATPTAHPAPRAVPSDFPKVLAATLTIRPPAYTGRAARDVAGFDAEVEEGAEVSWNLTLDHPVRDARLIFGQNDADALPLEAVGGDGARRTAHRLVRDPDLYHVSGTLTDGAAWNPPELHALKVLKDQPPVLRIVQPESARTEVEPTLPPAPPPQIAIEVAATDDYGVAEAHLVATVAKGTGEAVKFREQVIPFDPPPADAAAGPGDLRARKLTRTLDLGALGLEPGDELYFHVEAIDNRQPTPNRTRSETRFIILRGPETKASAAGQGVRGVNLVPQYFRSERQIVIDTEKLIADRPTATEAAFRERSNGLGIDQQLLRLRYGQLLGEELEGGQADHAEVSLDPLQATAPALPESPHAAASVTQRFLQEHQEQDREGGTEEQRAAGGAPATGQPLGADQVKAPFVDQHDSQDKATYFDRTTKGTMRDALAAMWEAEGDLRTTRPEAALPPENRALEILKDLQQGARAYVQHVGFDAPPLRVAERRLTGDATGVPERGAVPDPPRPDDPGRRAVVEALAALPWHESAGRPWTAEETARLRALEPALTAAATREPEAFLAGLQALRRAVAEPEGAPFVPADLRALQPALLRLLPAAGARPDRPVEPAPGLAEGYFRAAALPDPVEGAKGRAK